MYRFFYLFLLNNFLLKNFLLYYSSILLKQLNKIKIMNYRKNKINFFTKIKIFKMLLFDIKKLFPIFYVEIKLK